MTELIKRYREETGDCASKLTNEASIVNYFGRMLEWLNEKYKSLQSENAQLKDQLRWRPVSEKPENEGMYLAKVRLYERRETLTTKIIYFDGEKFPLSDVVIWLPIPPAPEGETK